MIDKMKCGYKRLNSTPCVIVDGPNAYGFKSSYDTEPVCVGCSRSPRLTGVKAPDNWKKQVEAYLSAKERS